MTENPHIITSICIFVLIEFHISTCFFILHISIVCKTQSSYSCLFVDILLFILICIFTCYTLPVSIVNDKRSRYSDLLVYLLLFNFIYICASYFLLIDILQKT